MRRVRHLGFSSYIVPIGQKTSQPLVHSCCNILLERTWHSDSRDAFSLDVHAKFNADAMNGIQIKAQLVKGKRPFAMAFVSAKLFRVSEASWVETLVASPTLTEGMGFLSGNVNQATLLTNELSGLEVYALEVTGIRKRKTFRKKVYFNHLGCFDSIWRLQQASNFQLITKLDE